MYFHGLEAVGHQVTRVATSRDGIDFEAEPEVLGRSYFRVFTTTAKPMRWPCPANSIDLAMDFPDLSGPVLFNPNMRHAAVLKRGDELLVFWTQVGDVPERILLSRIDMAGDWWQMEGWTSPVEVLRPERSWEGADAPLSPSVRSTAYGMVNQLRDPAIFEEDGRIFLLYAVAGESGIAIAEAVFE